VVRATVRRVKVRTFCRVCEPSCGLVAEVEDGRLVDLKADFDHPVTKGYACHKGMATLDIHHDPDRLSVPMRRTPGGEWVAVDWDEAVTDIAARLGAILDEHGPEAVGLYSGNPLAFNALAGAATGALVAGLGLRRTFSSGTQDCANKFVASQAVYGTSTVHPIPDLANTDLCLIIGGNPRVSQGSFFSIPNVVKELRQASARGATILFLNPRRVETAERGIGDTIQIKPDTDVYLLAALLTEIDRLGGFDERVLREHGARVQELRAFVHRYDAERVADVTGVPAATTLDLARRWVAAEAASVYASTGVNMGRQGTIAYWLVQMLSFVTGNLDRAGGNLKSDGFYPNARAGAGVPERSYGTTEWGSLRRGSLPGNLMADAILDSDRPVRAMLVVAGNPLLSIGGGDRLRKAFEQLELVVCIDLYRNATGELAHYTLPSTDMLEREDLNVVNVGLSYRPFAQYTPAVVEPQGERRPEWWICHRLLQAMGRPSLLDSDEPDLWGKWRHMLARGAGLDLDAMRADPGPIALAPPEPGRFFDAQVQTADGRVDCCPPVFAPALERAEALFVELAAEASSGSTRLKLITRRDAWMMNSWFRNVPGLTERPGRDDNPLFIHPSDAAARGLADGGAVRVWNEHGSLEATVRFDDELLPGVVAMAHGWGNRGTTGMRVAQAHPGVNANALLPSGPGSFEPLSSQAHMTGVPVEVEAARS
jgi:anaerobic selenocysteine-containing dehydrogenase